MGLVIRLRQQGRKNRHSFRLVVADRKSPRDGKYVENLGWYDPFAKDENNLSLKEERLKYWIDQGAQLSEKVKCLIKKKAPVILYKI